MSFSALDAANFHNMLELALVIELTVANHEKSTEFLIIFCSHFGDISESNTFLDLKGAKFRSLFLGDAYK